MDFVEIETAVRGACDGEMSIVDGIERTTENRDPARLMSGSSAALCLRGGQRCS
jgi:hypothetical protein